MLCAALALLAASAAARAEDAADVRDLLDRGAAAAALERLDHIGDAARPGTPASAPRWLFLRGVALMDLRRDTEALAAFEAMTELYPQLPDPWNNIALLHVRAGRLEPARQALEAALRNDPSHRLARANLGLVHLMLAVQAWEHAAAAGPADPELQQRLEAARALLRTPAR